jgi:hypothetical protein
MAEREALLECSIGAQLVFEPAQADVDAAAGARAAELSRQLELLRTDCEILAAMIPSLSTHATSSTETWW